MLSGVNPGLWRHLLFATLVGVLCLVAKPPKLGSNTPVDAELLSRPDHMNMFKTHIGNISGNVANKLAGWLHADAYSKTCLIELQLKIGADQYSLRGGLHIILINR